MMNVIKNIFHISKQTGFLLMVIICLSMQVQTAWAADIWQQTGGPEGGSILSLAIDPSNSQVVYAGTRGKGVFKTIAETSPTLYGSFTGNGIWQWGGSGWTQLTPDNPALMAVGE